MLEFLRTTVEWNETVRCLKFVFFLFDGGGIDRGETKEERRGGRKITTWLKEGNGIVNSSMGLWQRFPLTCFYRYRTSTFLGMYNSNRRDACRITDRIYNSEKKKKMKFH